MSETLHERDFYAWTQEQAGALRERPVASNAVDWEHVAEEIEEMGSEQRHACEAYTKRIIEHLFKLHATAAVDPVNHWKAEIDTFRSDLELRLTPTIKAHVLRELENLHLLAVRDAAKAFRRQEPGSRIDASLRWTWSEIVGEAESDPVDREYPLLREA